MPWGQLSLTPDFKHNVKQCTRQFFNMVRNKALKIYQGAPGGGRWERGEGGFMKRVVAGTALPLHTEPL
jgi:hypothetical protein